MKKKKKKGSIASKTQNQPKISRCYCIKHIYSWTVTWAECVFTMLKGGRNSPISFVAIWK